MELREEEIMKKVIFKKGDKVRYIPNHAGGKLSHKDCENGTVTAFNNKFVFVRYGNNSLSLPKATSHSNLVIFDDLYKKLDKLLEKEKS